MNTATPLVDRFSIAKLNTLTILGNSMEAAGTLIYVYLNMRRAGTTVVQNDAKTLLVATPIPNGTALPNGALLPDGTLILPKTIPPDGTILPKGTVYLASWKLPIQNLSFGGGPAKLKSGDRLYVQARAVGKEVSLPTTIYTIGGLDQPSAPYVLDEVAGTPRAVYELDTLLQGDVPLLLDYTTIPPTEVPFFPNAAQRVPEGVTVSVYIENTFLAHVQSDYLGHWKLDLAEHLNHPLLPLTKGQILTVKATRNQEPLPGLLPVQVTYPSATSSATMVLSGYFERQLFSYYPAQWKVDDVNLGNGDLANFTKVLALTLDDIKSYIDTFPAIFDIERCDPKYFPAIAALLGYPLNRLDSMDSQRLQIKNAIQFWRRKGTTEVFRILFYLLDYEIEMVELWTQDYKVMFPVEAVGYPKAHYPLGPPNNAPELIENGGTWYKSPYFGIIINPLTVYESTRNPDGSLKNFPYQIDYENCLWETGASSVSLSLDDLKYLLQRIDYFRPAHCVLDYIAFNLPMQECVPIPYQDPDYWEWWVQWVPTEPGWFLPYCNPDDPIYYRDGVTSTRPDKKGTVTLGVTRDPFGPFAPATPAINMKRLPERGYCHPGEELIVDLQPTTTETYTRYLDRSGMGIGFYPMQDPLNPDTIDRNDWPSRDPLTPPPLRDGKYRYTSRLVMSLETHEGA